MASKNERAEYRLSAYGATPEAAILDLADQIAGVDGIPIAGVDGIEASPAAILR